MKVLLDAQSVVAISLKAFSKPVASALSVCGRRRGWPAGKVVTYAAAKIPGRTLEFSRPTGVTVPSPCPDICPWTSALVIRPRKLPSPPIDG